MARTSAPVEILLTCNDDPQTLTVEVLPDVTIVGLIIDVVKAALMIRDFFKHIFESLGSFADYSAMSHSAISAALDSDKKFQIGKKSKLLNNLLASFSKDIFQKGNAICCCLLVTLIPLLAIVGFIGHCIDDNMNLGVILKPLLPGKNVDEEIEIINGVWKKYWEGLSVWGVVINFMIALFSINTLCSHITDVANQIWDPEKKQSENNHKTKIKNLIFWGKTEIERSFILCVVIAVMLVSFGQLNRYVEGITSYFDVGRFLMLFVISAYILYRFQKNIRNQLKPPLILIGVSALLISVVMWLGLLLTEKFCPSSTADEIIYKMIVLIVWLRVYLGLIFLMMRFCYMHSSWERRELEQVCERNFEKQIQQYNVSYTMLEMTRHICSAQNVTKDSVYRYFFDRYGIEIDAYNVYLNHLINRQIIKECRNSVLEPSFDKKNYTVGDFFYQIGYVGECVLKKNGMSQDLCCLASNSFDEKVSTETEHEDLLKKGFLSRLLFWKKVNN